MGVSVGVLVAVGVLVRVRVTVGVDVLVGGEVGVLVMVGRGSPTIVSARSTKLAGSLTTVLSASTNWVSLVIGSGGENCQWIAKRPGAMAQKPSSAMRKSGPHPEGQVFNAPSANAP